MSAAPTEVFGRYLVYESLGVGGMARVDRAEIASGEGAGRQVALKRMLPHLADHDSMIEAFAREARLLGHLRHANVAQTYEFGQIEDVHFIAMELVTGPTLREILQHCAQTSLPVPTAVALNLLNQICDALDHAHNLRDESGQPLGIIHRDVSPSNVIIDRAGVVKLIDFGVAKASAAGMQTTSGMIKGKFGYMAPEYLLGDIDARADLFAIGVIAYELLTNRPLFTAGDDMETLRRLRGMPIEPPSRKNPDVPPEIDDIVMTALSRDPDRRWQHATALRAALTTLTRRLGLAWTNQQVCEWIAWAFEQRRPARAPRPASVPAAGPSQPEEPSLSVRVEMMEPAAPATGPFAAGLLAAGLEVSTTLTGDLEDSPSLGDATLLSSSLGEATEILPESLAPPIAPLAVPRSAPVAAPVAPLAVPRSAPVAAPVAPLAVPRSAPIAAPRAPTAPEPQPPRLRPAPRARTGSLPDEGGMTLLGPAAPRPAPPTRASGPIARPSPALVPLPQPPALVPQPQPPVLVPLPQHPRRGTIGPDLVPAALTPAPGAGLAPASVAPAPALAPALAGPRRARAILGVVLLAAALAGGATYLVLNLLP